MTPLEVAIRAACQEMGADPEGWKNFERIGQVSLDALLDCLPPWLRLPVRKWLAGDYE